MGGQRARGAAAKVRRRASDRTGRARLDLSTDLLEERTHFVNVVGECFYQDALLAICGGAKRARSVLVHTLATLAPTDDPRQPNPVTVMIDGSRVGHLNGDAGAALCAALRQRARPCVVRAAIVGGWKSEEGEGDFGVVVGMPDLSNA